MLLPIETKFDLDKNIVYTEVDELGTYCLMDMEQWFVSLGILGEEYQPQPMLFSLASSVYDEIALERFSEEDSKIGFRDDAVGEEAVTLPGSERRLSYAPSYQKNVTPVDVVMLLQTSGQLRDVFRTQKDMIIKVMDDLIGNNNIGDVRFCIITYDIDSGAKILEETPGDIWFEDSSVLASRLEINYSELMPEQIYYIDEDYKREVDDAIASTKGINITYTYHAATDVYEHICKNVAPPQNKFDAIVATNYERITLNSILERNGMTDTDGDSITDWKEIENTLIKWNTDGTVMLPTFGECQALSKKPYSEDGLERFKGDLFSGQMPSDAAKNYLNNCEILPIRSNPAKEDTDGDGLPDGKAAYDRYEYGDEVRDIAIAPKDPDPMKKSEYANIWLSRVHEIQVREKTAYHYSDEYYKPQKIKIDWKEGDINFYEAIMSYLSSIGSETLDFRYDDQKLALHSDTTQWQKLFGYNDLYDKVFKKITNMDKGKYDFVYDGTNYVLWAWKGDYLNLGPGAELGFYYRDKSPEDTKKDLGAEHWTAEGTLPMTLSLYQRANENASFFSRYHWFPDEDQWWITGFVPDVYHIEKVNETDLIHVSSVDFKDKEEMLKALKRKYYGKDKGKNLIFDEVDNKLWIIF